MINRIRRKRSRSIRREGGAEVAAVEIR